jgi:catechol 2,3-dioxygenase
MEKSDFEPGEQPIAGRAPSGYRLPSDTRPGAVRLQVGDLGRALEYYTTLLGFRILHRSATAAMLGVPANDEPLLEIHALPGARTAPRNGRFGLYHFAVLVPDRGALGRFVRHLTDNRVRPGVADHLVSEALYLHDPDGLGIEVYADRPRTAWERQGDQILMDSRPLDLDSLLAAAGDEPWRGMPAGTAIGHIHLHVGDLAGASAFYHEGLGLDATVWSYPGALFLSAGGYHHHLGVNTWAGPDARPSAEDEARLLEWEMVLPSEEDVRAAGDNMRRAGFEIKSAERGWSARDPWDTTVRVSF